jgi:S1-C subfamily serine protease
MYPKEIPLLVERTFTRNQCVECHLIGDFLNQQRENEGKLDKLAHMFRSPDIKNLGIYLDIPKGLVVKEVKGAVQTAGMQPGDRITAFNGKAVWTFADLQSELDQLPRPFKDASLRVEREGKLLDLKVQLPPKWWFTDIRYKQLTVDPRVYFESIALTADEKKSLGLKNDSFASRVKYVSSFAETLKSHRLKVGDVVVSVDGTETDEVADTADFFIRLRKKAGDSVRLVVLRNNERIEMPLQTFRMSFRK